MGEEPRDLVEPKEEIEGNTEGTSDFVFCRIGSSVPLKPSGSSFDLKNPPLRPLVISERFGVLFLAHPGGFFVVKTQEVIKLAKEIKEIEDANGNREKMRHLCIEESSILDVQIGGVHILALSTDSSTLAVAVERKICFFSASSLLNKEQEPVFTRSLDDSEHVKDLVWQKISEKSFIVLSSHGSLYYGNLEGHLKDVLDNVDAVDWSVEGNSFVVARKSSLSIFSSEFEKQLSIVLKSQSWTDTDSECIVKVDSVKWVRSDSIVVGCIQENENGEEVSYMVQVITGKGCGIVEAASQLVVVSFNELFHGIVDDIVPSGGGPCLFMSYLDRWGLALAANRKNADDHVVLLAWSLNNNTGEVVALEFEQDKFIPRIELQENRDENLILGFDVDKISIYEKLELKIDVEEVKMLSPHCILLCLTCEGKLIMYHVARVSEPSIPLQSSCSSIDDVVSVNEKYSSTATLVKDTTVTTSRLMDDGSFSLDANRNQIISEVADINSGKELKSLGYVHSVGIEEQPKITAARNDMGIASPIFEVHAEKSLNLVQLPKESPLKQGSMASDTSATRQSSKVLLKNNEVSGGLILGNVIQSSSVGSQSVGKLHTVDGFGAKSSTSTGFIQGAKDYHVFSPPSDAQRPAWMRPGQVESAPAFRSSPSLFKESVIPAYRSPGLLNSEPKLSKQFYNVKDMTKELDTLLAYIEQECGFSDAFTTSVLKLEAALENISDIFRMCKAKIAEQAKGIQQLQDKRVQVSARQIYMEGIVKQASNNQYWDIWNRQKLGPEFELKRQQIVKLNQSLTNQLVELERHFNTLELNKFGDSGGAPTGRRTLVGNLESGRQNQFVHSLYNTLNSQLAAAQQLSECLSKQMAVLNISSPPAKRPSIAKELLGSIGLAYDFDSFQSPEPKRIEFAQDSTKKISMSSSSTAVKAYSRRKALSAVKDSEPESSRRRRDSLDRSWAGFEPPKTTVKRMSQEERFRMSAEKSVRPTEQQFKFETAEGFVASQGSVGKFQPHTSPVNKDVQEKIAKQDPQSQSSFMFKWAQEPSQVPPTVGSKPSSIQAVLSPAPPSSPAVLPSLLSDIQNKIISSSYSAEQLNYEVAKRGGKSDSSTANVDSLSQTRFNALFEASTPSQAFSKGFSPVFSSKVTTTVKTAQASESFTAKSGGNIVATLSTGSLMHGADTRGGSFSMMGTNHSSLPASVNGSSTVTRKSQPNELVSTTAFSHTISESFPAVTPIQSSGSPLPSLVSLSASLPESRATLSTLSVGGTFSPATSMGNANQTSLASVSSAVSSQPLHPSSTAFSFHSQNSKVSPAFSLPMETVTSHATPPHNLQLSEVSSTSEQALLPAIGVSSGLSSGSLSSLLTTASSVFPPSSHSSSASSNISSITAKENHGALDLSVVQEDEMEEEAPETSTMLNLGALGSFGLGSTPVPSGSKPSPFGGSFVSAATSPTSSPFSLTATAGELFRPASLTIPSAQPVQSSQPMNLSGGLSRFGQPAQIGAGQQALGTVLGGFGQSRQLGVGVPGMGLATSGSFGGGRFSAAATSAGGFASAAGGGFSAVASSGGGFAGAARGGFAAMASNTAGFAAAPSGGGGYAAAASAGGGFAGGVGAFGANQGSSGFSAFATTRAGQPPPELLTKMRK